MSEPFLGQISIFAFDFPPKNFAQCDGQMVRILQNRNLFQLLGTTYGGDGVTYFALPALRGRAPMKVRTVHKAQGEKGGEEGHLLLTSEMPFLQHTFMASGTTGNAPIAQGNVLAASANTPYQQPPAGAPLNPGT